MARILVAAAVALAGCSSTQTSLPPSAASGMKRLSGEAMASDTAGVVKDRPRRRTPFAVSRNLHRLPRTIVHDWSGVAACESSGRWHLNTGMFDGGLQFLPRTWLSYHGDDFSASADLATKKEQVIVAERVLASQGVAAWPACGRWLR